MHSRVEYSFHPKWIRLVLRHTDYYSHYFISHYEEINALRRDIYKLWVFSTVAPVGYCCSVS